MCQLFHTLLWTGQKVFGARRLHNLWLIRWYLLHVSHGQTTRAHGFWADNVTSRNSSAPNTWLDLSSDENSLPQIRVKRAGPAVSCFPTPILPGTLLLLFIQTESKVSPRRILQTLQIYNVSCTIQCSQYALYKFTVTHCKILL